MENEEDMSLLEPRVMCQMLGIVNKHYTTIDFNEVDMRIYLSEISHLRKDKSLCLPILKSTSVLLYGF